MQKIRAKALLFIAAHLTDDSQYGKGAFPLAEYVSFFALRTVQDLNQRGEIPAYVLASAYLRHAKALALRTGATYAQLWAEVHSAIDLEGPIRKLAAAGDTNALPALADIFADTARLCKALARGNADYLRTAEKYRQSAESVAMEINGYVGSRYGRRTSMCL